MDGRFLYADKGHIQPWWASNGVSMVFVFTADFIFPFGKTDANVGADQAHHVVACVRRDQPVFDKAHGDSQVRVDNQPMSLS